MNLCPRSISRRIPPSHRGQIPKLGQRRHRRRARVRQAQEPAGDASEHGFDDGTGEIVRHGEDE